MSNLTEICREAYDALNARDLDRFLELTDPEIKITSLIAEAEGAEFYGHDGVREWWETVVQSLGGIRFDLGEIRELGDGLMLVKLVIGGEVAGVQVEQLIWQAIEVRDGERASWWQPFRTEQEALDALEARRAA